MNPTEVGTAETTRDRSFQLMLVDEDPIFRLGLRIWLEQFADFTIVAEASNAEEALDYLRQAATTTAVNAESTVGDGSGDEVVATSSPLETAQPASTQNDNSAESSAAQSSVAGSADAGSPTAVDLAIIDIGLGQQDSSQILGLQLCQQIRTEFPALPLLVLSAQAAPLLREAALHAGATAFGMRGMPVAQLVQLIRQTIDQRVSPLPPPFVESSLSPRPSSGWWTQLRWQIRQQGFAQIDSAMDAVNEALEITPSFWARIVLQGRQRELRAARWLTQQLLSMPESSAGTTPENQMGQRGGADAGGVGDAGAIAISEYLRPAELGRPGGLAVNAAAIVNASPGDIQSLVFEAVFHKLQHSLENHSEVPLELDILRPEKKRELLYLTLRQLENQLTELRYSQVAPGQLSEKVVGVLKSVWQGVTSDFLGKYYTLQINGTEQAVVNTLLADAALVEQTMLRQIPLVPVLLGHLMFAEPLAIAGTLEAATSYEALIYSQQLLENTLIQLACSVLQPLLNHFADVEAFKKRFYHRQVMSTREIERFRNNLSWRYRWDNAVHHPKAIFESQYRLFVLEASGVHICHVYAPRRQELEALSGLQYGLTLVLEARDALSPRFKTLVALVGSGLVYVLTEVVGRGIGLIGRGILQGIGNAWQESRPKRERRE